MMSSWNSLCSLSRSCSSCTRCRSSSSAAASHSVLKMDLRFGVLFVGASGASDVGCVREVAEHERLRPNTASSSSPRARSSSVSSAASPASLPVCHHGVTRKPPAGRMLGDQVHGDCLQLCELFSLILLFQSGYVLHSRSNPFSFSGVRMFACNVLSSSLASA
jgi:hypothetical protein